jgi:alpha-tubulin suppressor-like RCC1 family protein
MDILLTGFQPTAKQFALWLLGCLLSIGLAACGGGGSDGPTAPSITAQPASVTVTAGATASFGVTAAGSAPLTYQWQKDGAPIDGATSASYATPATTIDDNGALFTVIVSNAAGSVTSTAATLTVGPATAPSIVTQPAAQSAVAPAPATFTVVANGSDPLTYQWTRNGAAIAGANEANYTTPATTVADDNGTLFAVRVTNVAGTATSDNAALTVTAAPTPPVVSTQPANQTVNAGQTATFSVAATGTAPLAYQWQKNGSDIAGATSASFTTPATVDADTGSTFHVTITNAAGSVRSADATLTVTPLAVMPTITAQPADVSVNAGQAASFSVSTTGTAPLGFQWKRGGTAIAGATGATYTLANTAPSDNGAQFTVTVSNAVGSVTSDVATLTVVGATGTAPTITTQPANQSVTVGQTATFSVIAAGTSPFTYQWRKNGTAIGGATVASYTTPTTTAADDSAQFSVVVSNGVGTVTSANATLTVGTVVTAPAIDTQPQSTAVFVGDTATFSVAAHGTAPLAYQWKKNGVVITGATGASYTTPATTFSDNLASFTVVVTNPSPTTATSAAAVLTVTLPPSTISQVSAGYGHSVALRSSGAVYSWSTWGGNGNYNALAGAGNKGFSVGSTVRAASPDDTPFLGVSGIAAGYTHSVAVKSDGTVWSWGNAANPNYGQCPMGDGACTTRPYPVQVKDASGVPFSGAAQVAAGYYFSVVRKTDGSVWSWGNNDYGQLGDASTTFRLNPVQVTDPTTGGFFGGVTQVAASLYHVVALKSNGTVFAWGRAGSGQIGDGSVATSVSVPKQVEVTPGVPLTGIIAVAAGEMHSIAVKSDGTVYAWGENTNGALGDGTTTDRTRATVVRDNAGNPITGVIAVAAGTQSSVLLKSDGTVLTTGQNDIGQLGDNSTAAFQINPVFVRDAAGTVFGSVNGISTFYKHTVVKRSDGTVWAWGLNSTYQLGDTTSVNRRNPVPAPANAP